MPFQHQHKQVTHCQPSSRLNVIAAISNPVRYKSRYELYRHFAAHMKQFDVNLFVVEMAFGARSHEITEENNPNHIQVRGEDEVWHKENLINIGLRYLPKDWQYMAWVDADVMFTNPKWVEETVEALQHYQVVQLWQDAIDLGPDGRAIQTQRSFCYQYVQGATPQWRTRCYGPFWHPGFAWGARREAIDALGGLMEHAILGAGDHHMALCLVGEGHRSMPKGLHPNYIEEVMAWQDKAERHIQRNIGYVPGTITHHWHGKKKDRKYWDRWKIIVDNLYDPKKDIKKNWQGVLHLAGNKPRLRDQIRAYFRQRNEDSIDTE